MSPLNRIRARLITVGVKILAGVALASNLRTAVVKLQDEFLALPEFFRVDPKADIVQAIERTFQVSDRQQLNDREAYSHLFDRNERRDLAKNSFIIQTQNDRLIVSNGNFDHNGSFTESVERLTLVSSNSVEDGAKLRTLIDDVLRKSDSSSALQRQVVALGSKVADAGLEAETTQNEILQHVEEIQAKEHELHEIRRHQRKFTLLMGGFAILANMIVFFILVRFLVEQPLHKLTRTIEELNSSIRAICSIIATVDEITGQTKLLALNATIEAARAGAAGKGFAVVAGEVKELSLKTEQATDDVLHKVDAIEEARSALLNHLEEIDRRMQSLNLRTGNITRAVIDQRTVTGNIAILAGRTSENTRTVSLSIAELSDAAARTRNIAGQVHEFSSEISTQLTDLLENTTCRLEQLSRHGTAIP